MLRRVSGRMPVPPHDYDAGHRSYVSHLEEWARRWVRTKPFSAPPQADLPTLFHGFAHIVQALDLPLRAQVLDAGCGPGWLSEFLARCGYWVTGVDISEEMVEIAEERIAAVPTPLGEVDRPQAEFRALPVREIPWTERFDAIVAFDAMHHFDREVETLERLYRALVPGGVLFVHEGVRPPPGSAAEHEVVKDMEQYGTLEAWFTSSYLRQLMKRVGFVEVRGYFEADELLDLSRSWAAVRLFVRYLASRTRLRPPPTNTWIAVKPPVDARSRPPFAARLEPVGDWREEDEHLVHTIKVTNAGRCYWPTSEAFPFVEGTVTVAPFRAVGGDRVELPRTTLPAGVSPAQVVEVAIRQPREGGRTDVSVDVVREGIAWFSDLGGSALRLAPPTGV